MKTIRFFLLSIICIGIVGCGASKKVRQSLHEATAANEQADVRTEVKQTTESESQTVAEASKSESGEMRHIELEFDTALPVDSARGTPPLKRVTVTDTKRNSQKGTRKQTTTAATKQMEVTVQDSSQTNIQTETVVEQETQKKPRSLWWLWMIAGAALVGLIVWAWRRYRWCM